jgi:hypothetical protein
MVPVLDPCRLRIEYGLPHGPGAAETTTALPLRDVGLCCITYLEASICLFLRIFRMYACSGTLMQVQMLNYPASKHSGLWPVHCASVSRATLRVQLVFPLLCIG